MGIPLLEKVPGLSPESGPGVTLGWTRSVIPASTSRVVWVARKRRNGPAVGLRIYLPHTSHVPVCPGDGMMWRVLRRDWPGGLNHKYAQVK